jgi:hypothetical protein
MKQVLLTCAVLIAVGLLTGCAAGPNDLAGTPGPEGEVAGFWPGLWHGIISPITFVISLFSEKTSIYEVHNNGGWYNFGFILGVMVIFGGSGGGASSRKRWSD